VHGGRVDRLEARRLLSAGDPDLSFGGGDGRVLTDFAGRADAAAAVAVQADAKLVVAGTSAGDVAVSRYRADGSPDTTFSGDGLAVTDFGGGERVRSVAIQPDGKVLVAGTGVVRYNPNGTLDTTFGGGDGRAGDGQQFTDVGVLPGGRIVATEPNMLGLVAFTPAGAVDTSFGGGDGIVRTRSPSGGAVETGTSLVVLPDGNVLVGGSVTAFNVFFGNDDFAVARYTPDGVLDTSFAGGTGLFTFGFGDGLEARYDRVVDLAVAADGRILLLGHSSDSGTYTEPDLTLGRLLPDGTPDVGLGGGDGILTAGLAGYGQAVPPAITPSQDGRILVAAAAAPGPEQPPGAPFVVGRFNADGSADSGFGSGGVAAVSFGTGAETGAEARAIAVVPTGQVLVVGAAGGDFALARLVGAPADDPDDQIAEAILTTVPGTFANRLIGFGADVDVFRVEVAAGQRIGIDVDRAAGSTLDAYLRLFDAAGRQIAASDNATAPGETGGGVDPYLEVTFPAAGTYYAGVSARGNGAYNVVTGAGDATGGSTGRFTLTLTDRTPRPPGGIDPTFGYGGAAPSAAAEDPFTLGRVAVLPGGGFVQAGSLLHPGGRSFHPDTDLLVHYYRPDGFLDGRVTPQAVGEGDYNEVADLVAALPGGKVLAVGTRTYWSDEPGGLMSSILVARFGADGAPDATFGTGGLALAGIGSEGFDRPAAVAVQADGKILVAGTGIIVADQTNPTDDPARRDFFVVRFNADGTLDTTFGRGGLDGDGVVSADFFGLADQLTGVAVLSGGKILATGTATTPQGTDFAAARFNADGTIDTAFGGGDGKVTVDFGPAGGDDVANALAPLAGGKFLLVGSAQVPGGSPPALALARLNADGSPDATFGGGGDGKVVARPGPGVTAAGADVVVASDGKYVVAGAAGFTLARFNSDGTPDVSLGDAAGFQSGGGGSGIDLALLPDGSYLLAGTGAIAKRLAGPSPQPPVGAQVLEAERSALSGAVVSTAHAGYAGGGFADFVNASGDAAAFTVSVPAEGLYDLEFRYANGSAIARSMQLAVNGAVAQAKLAFAPTGAWATWKTVTVRVPLAAGTNTVRLAATGQSGPNLDALTVRPASAAPPQTLQAEQALVAGAVVSAAVPGYTGTGFVDFVHPAGDFVEWSVNAPSAGSYELEFRCANGSAGDRPLELKVNGSVVQTKLAFPPTGAWTSWKTVKVTVSLATGANKVRLTATGASGANIDSLVVRPAVALLAVA
jgi:uncharacterized delta-60 repeat protein